MQEAESKQVDLLCQIFESEPMLTADIAPSGIHIEQLFRHVLTLEFLGYEIHSKVLGWRQIDGKERRTTYYGLFRKMDKTFFTWGYEKSFFQAFDDLEESCRGIGFNINPQKRDLPLPEKLHLYHFLQSMVE